MGGSVRASVFRSQICLATQLNGADLLATTELTALRIGLGKDTASCDFTFGLARQSSGKLRCASLP